MRGVGGTRYSADITAGALKVPESRLVVRLLLKGVDHKGWDEAIVKENVLQARTTATAIRLARLVRKRLETMDADLWKLVRDGNSVPPVETLGARLCLADGSGHRPGASSKADLMACWMRWSISRSFSLIAWTFCSSGRMTSPTAVRSRISFGVRTGVLASLKAGGSRCRTRHAQR
jgi:BrxA